MVYQPPIILSHKLRRPHPQIHYTTYWKYSHQEEKQCIVDNKIRKKQSMSLYKEITKAMNEVLDLETNMAIHEFQMGLRRYFLLAIDLSIQRVSTLHEMLSKEKLYIEVDELQ